MNTVTKRTTTIESTSDAWGPNGALGNAAEFAAPAPSDVSTEVDAALGLQAISIRLHKSLLDDLKLIASENGIGYQPLIRQALTRFANAEIKQMLKERIASEKTDRPRMVA